MKPKEQYKELIKWHESFGDIDPYHLYKNGLHGQISKESCNQLNDLLTKLKEGNIIIVEDLREVLIAFLKWHLESQGDKWERDWLEKFVDNFIEGSNKFKRLTK